MSDSAVDREAIAPGAILQPDYVLLRAPARIARERARIEAETA
jgi:hypothetical protein